MTVPTLTAAIGRHPYLAPLNEGSMRSSSFDLDIAPINVTLRNSMTRMVREAAFDLCEMSPTSYLMARLAGAPIIALPLFTYRLFPFDRMAARQDSGVQSPTDLGGKRIGTRTWAQPIGLWLRHVLTTFYATDLGDATWSFIAEDPVAGVRRPAGSLDRRGRTLAELLESGEVEVAMGDAAVPGNCRPVIANPEEEATRWYAESGLVPANHLLVARDDLARRVDLSEVFALFDQAKNAYVADGRKDDPAIEQARRITGADDPMVNGWSANAELWGTIVEAMHAQGMIASVPDPEDVVMPLEPN